MKRYVITIATRFTGIATFTCFSLQDAMYLFRLWNSGNGEPDDCPVILTIKRGGKK